MEIAIKNIQGKETGKKAKLDDSVFGIEPNEHAIYLDVKHFLANQRQGTHKAKERAEVAGSTRKIKRQKGTGGARAGSLKSPVFVGGGRVFGPRPKDYGFKLNKKVKRLARRSALSSLAKSGKIVVLEDFNMESPKTKEYVSILKNLEADKKKTLLVVAEPNSNIVLSARNYPKGSVATASNLSTYQIMNAGELLITESSLNLIHENLKK